MGGRFDGKVAFITGAARGQGRSHAVRLASEGADIIALDLCKQIESVPYPLSTPEDLAETAALVRAQGREVVTGFADVRDYGALQHALDAGVAHLKRLDIVCANAGIASYGTAEGLSEASWKDVIETNLTGVWHTAKASIPHLRTGKRGGVIILISSTAGLRAVRNAPHYVAAKHGVVGLMRALALELAPEMIRVNAIHPGSVDTDMIHNDVTYQLFAPDLTHPTREQVAPRFRALHGMPVEWAESIDVSNAVSWLASDEARYVTGVSLPVDAGTMINAS